MTNFIESFDGTALFYNKEEAKNAKAAVVIVHGLAEYSGRYDYVAEKFHNAGFSTYRFDHRGHGKSEGERGYYKDYEDMLEDVNVVVDKAIEENPDKPVFLLGHSMGGFAVSLYGAKYRDKNLAGVITSGGLTHDNNKMTEMVGPGLDPHTELPNELGDGVCSVKEVVEAYVADPLNLKKYQLGLLYALKDGIAWFKENEKDFSYPVLILHGRDDALVNFKDSFDFFENNSSKDCQIKIYKGLCHEIMNEYAKDEVIGDIIAWIDNRL